VHWKHYLLKRVPGLLLSLSVWQQVDLDIGVRGSPDVHGGQVLALDDGHVQDARTKVVVNLKRQMLCKTLVVAHCVISHSEPKLSPSSTSGVFPLAKARLHGLQTMRSTYDLTEHLIVDANVTFATSKFYYSHALSPHTNKRNTDADGKSFQSDICCCYTKHGSTFSCMPPTHLVVYPSQVLLLLRLVPLAPVRVSLLGLE
jgi:hypothetical protein